jgi:uncharacterized protein with HEPN domain
MKRRDYRDYLQDILDAVNDIESFVGNINKRISRRTRRP